MGFWNGVITGIVGITIIAHIVYAGRIEQCELDHHVKKCDLLYVPITDSNGEE